MGCMGKKGQRHIQKENFPVNYRYIAKDYIIGSPVHACMQEAADREKDPESMTGKKFTRFYIE